MSIKIKGIVKYQKIEGGFWSIITDSGEELRPSNMPEQFKQDDLLIECRVTDLEETFSISMWGKAVRIVSFKTSQR